MRPNLCRTVLHVSIVAVLLLTLNADIEDSDCDGRIKVRRNTVYGATLGEDLRINCTVELCKNSPPSVSWYKLEQNYVPIDVSSSSHIKTGTFFSRREVTSFLVFQAILQSDAGLYKCQSHHSVSHAINVSVFGDPTDATQKNHTNSSTALDSELKERPWMYVYTAAGIVAFVIIVIVASVASMQECKGKSKKEARTRDQRTAIPMAGKPSPHTSLQASPRRSPPVPPSRRSTQRKTSPSRPNGSPLPGDREPQNTVVEEKSSIVYAALNHQPRGAAAARPRRPKEESSEYAVICVEGH